MAPSRYVNRYVLLRLGQGFLPGLLVGIVWALCTVRRRPAATNPDPALPERVTGSRPALRRAG